MSTTPVALFVFNRPDRTRQVFDEIAQYRPSRLFVVADGPRSTQEAIACNEVREIVEGVSWDCEVVTNYADGNLGCRDRIVSGLNWVFEHCDEAIILEDDCLPNQSFFHFCHELLEFYRMDERVMTISGDNFHVPGQISPYSYHFTVFPHCWGWATWRRAWKLYDLQMTYWPTVRDTRWLANIVGDEQVVRYWRRIMDEVYAGKMGTWDYQWVFACWLQNALSIAPNKNLVSNIGFGSEATHTSDDTSPFAALATYDLLLPLVHPPFMARDTAKDDVTHQAVICKRALDRFPRLIYGYMGTQASKFLGHIATQVKNGRRDWQ